MIKASLGNCLERVLKTFRESLWWLCRDLEDLSSPGDFCEDL